MSRTIRVRYENGVLKPLEPIDDLGLREGEEVFLIIIEEKGEKEAGKEE